MYIQEIILIKTYIAPLNPAAKEERKDVFNIKEKLIFNAKIDI